jgi:hypothetical protein
MLGGIFAICMRLYMNYDWKTSSLLFVQKVHGYYGYLIIYYTQVVIITGIIRRTNIGLHDQPKRVILIVVNVLLFVGTLLLFEVRH